MKEKRLKVPIFFLFITGLLCVLGTAAYFSDFDDKVNTAVVGSVITEIDEDFPDPTPTPIEDDPTYKKTIWTGNFSGNEKGFNADCYVRMLLSYSDDDIGRGVELLGLDTSNWIYNAGDGYYYYKSKVAEGETTSSLCTGFRINADRIDDTYKDSILDFEINVYEESVQAEGFSDYESAWEHFKNPISVQTERRGTVEKSS